MEVASSIEDVEVIFQTSSLMLIKWNKHHAYQFGRGLAGVTKKHVRKVGQDVLHQPLTLLPTNMFVEGMELQNKKHKTLLDMKGLKLFSFM